MDKLDDQLLKKIEEVLGIKFYNWQRSYILNERMILDMQDMGRGTGKTFAYIIKQLFESDEPLFLNNPDMQARNCDWFMIGQRLEQAHLTNYPKVYTHALKICYDAFIDGGIIPRKVKFPNDKSYAVERQQLDLMRRFKY